METAAQPSDSPQMDVLDLPAIARRTGGTAVLGESRRFAAVLAFVFPTVAAGLVLGGLIKMFEQPEQALTHPLFVLMFMPGCAALVFWIKRYTKPALKAFTSESQVRIERGEIVMLGQRFPLMPDMMLRYNRSAVELVNRGEVLVRKPAFFVRIIEERHP